MPSSLARRPRRALLALLTIALLILILPTVPADAQLTPTAGTHPLGASHPAAAAACVVVLDSTARADHIKGFPPTCAKGPTPCPPQAAAASTCLL